ncbi:hypothetical protein CORC01_12881 [Colletotrichum orchidophilum]|uniref:Uncharacterized protein n=1 Tax=Colletotrichum orchidophilum TaxID=1209926 RepID=A0A1G4ARK5_9PEZI|nr:uncharacterized protein CORC01_12881 [Colletotrichum orchidophilum]OHE91807.1 hypothetical protein CORC01_12881 [Colletotrichum orchidophilum]
MVAPGFAARIAVKDGRWHPNQRSPPQAIGNGPTA